jgi:hypothetical protein
LNLQLTSSRLRLGYAGNGLVDPALGFVESGDGGIQSDLGCPDVASDLAGVRSRRLDGSIDIGQFELNLLKLGRRISQYRNGPR